MKNVLALLTFFCAACGAQQSGNIVALAPNFRQLVDPSSPIEKVADGFKFTEGPLWSPKNFLLFSDIYGDRIYKLKPGGKPSVFREEAGFPNGLTYDRQNRLVICDQKNRRIVRLTKSGTPEVLADKWNGKRLNCPDDVVSRSDGTIYFTDPYWKFPPGSVQELDFQAVFRITPDGKLSVEAKDFGLPNGIAFSPDEKTLYIGDSRRRIIYAFNVAEDGSLSGQRQVANLQSPEKGAVDGMKVDSLGNIFTTGPGGIWVIDSTGKHLGTIKAPEIPANCAWGGKDFKTLYLTAPKAVYKVRTLVSGKPAYRQK